MRHTPQTATAVAADLCPSHLSAELRAPAELREHRPAVRPPTCGFRLVSSSSSQVAVGLRDKELRTTWPREGALELRPIPRPNELSSRALLSQGCFSSVRSLSRRRLTSWNLATGAQLMVALVRTSDYLVAQYIGFNRVASVRQTTSRRRRAGEIISATVGVIECAGALGASSSRRRRLSAPSGSRTCAALVVIQLAGRVRRLPFGRELSPALRPFSSATCVISWESERSRRQR